jgi:hypothetical protein
MLFGSLSGQVHPQSHRTLSLSIVRATPISGTLAHISAGTLPLSEFERVHKHRMGGEGREIR